jgi:hypothetical protein
MVEMVVREEEEEQLMREDQQREELVIKDRMEVEVLTRVISIRVAGVVILGRAKVEG